jgi:hypothetical protein
MCIVRSLSTEAVLRVVCLAVAVTVLVGCSGNKPFEAGDWRTGDDVERGRMVRSLLASTLLSGQRREDVIALLGAPDLSSRNELKYDVRCRQGKCGVDWQYSLVVEFGPNNVVCSVLLLD